MDILGEKNGILPMGSPILFPCQSFSIEKRTKIQYPVVYKTLPSEARTVISNPSLKQALLSTLDFDTLYIVMNCSITPFLLLPFYFRILH